MGDILTVITCITCQASKPDTEFYSPPSLKGKRFSKCKTCCASAAKKWQSSNRGNMYVNHTRWKHKNPERMRIIKTAGSAVHNAVKSGKLTRPERCEQCGIAGVRIEAAHIDYAQALNVRWLCRSCHVRFDKENAKSSAFYVPIP